MINLGLSTANLAAFTRGLLGNHNIKIQVQVVDLNHNFLGELSQYFLDGQVNIDTTADITRTASIQLFDPKRSLNFDSNSPADGALFLDRMIRINYQVTSDDYNPVVSIPLFCGPITGCSRDDAVISLTCSGKEILAKRPAWRTKNYPARTFRSSIIRDLLAATGESKFTFFDWTLRTTVTYGTTRETDVWALAKFMAGGNRLFYDGRGYLVLQAPSNTSLFTFSSGDGGSLISYPQVTYSADDIANTVLVKGGIPKGSKKPVEYTAYAARTHPLSKELLGRNGYPRIIARIVEDTNLTTVAQVKARANADLASALLQGIDASWDSIPVPHLEGGDVVTLRTPEYSQSIRLEKFTVPLKFGANQSNGYNARRSTNKTAIRAKKAGS